MITMTTGFISQSANLINANDVGISDVTCTVSLVKAPFTPSAATVPDDVTLADFATSTPLSPSAVPSRFWDPVRLQYYSRLIPPAGGWAWRTTAGTNLPQTIYGYVLKNGAGTIIGSDLLENPVALSAAGQAVIIDDIIIPYSKNMFAQDPLPG